MSQEGTKLNMLHECPVLWAVHHRQTLGGDATLAFSNAFLAWSTRFAFRHHWFAYPACVWAGVLTQVQLGLANGAVLVRVQVHLCVCPFWPIFVDSVAMTT